MKSVCRSAMYPPALIDPTIIGILFNDPVINFGQEKPLSRTTLNGHFYQLGKGFRRLLLAYQVFRVHSDVHFNNQIIIQHYCRLFACCLSIGIGSSDIKIINNIGNMQFMRVIKIISILGRQVYLFSKKGKWPNISVFVTCTNLHLNKIKKRNKRINYLKTVLTILIKPVHLQNPGRTSEVE